MLSAAEQSENIGGLTEGAEVKTTDNANKASVDVDKVYKLLRMCTRTQDSSNTSLIKNEVLLKDTRK